MEESKGSRKIGGYLAILVLLGFIAFIAADANYKAAQRVEVKTVDSTLVYDNEFTHTTQIQELPNKDFMVLECKKKHVYVKVWPDSAVIRGGLFKEQKLKPLMLTPDNSGLICSNSAGTYTMLFQGQTKSGESWMYIRTDSVSYMLSQGKECPDINGNK